MNASSNPHVDADRREHAAVQTAARRWERLAIPAATVWSGAYGLLGLYWANGGVGFPFGVNDDAAADMGSFFVGLTPARGGSAIAILGLVAVLVGLAMLHPVSDDRRRVRIALLGFAWLACVTLVLAVPDVRVLQNAAYLLLLITDKLQWPATNQFICMAGGLLWGAAAIALQRRNTRSQAGRRVAWTTPDAARRWGRWATYTAAALALPYGLVRLGWMLGFPVGVTEEFVNTLNADADAKGAGIAKYAFGSESIVGAILILGLTQRWGERIPPWIPLLGGKRVPISLAVVPATLVAALLTLGGIRVYGFLLPDLVQGRVTSENWGIATPGAAVLPWGIMLGAATLAYYLRRRGDHAAAALR